jgi:hypothetical protein
VPHPVHVVLLISGDFRIPDFRGARLLLHLPLADPSFARLHP